MLLQIIKSIFYKIRYGKRLSLGGRICFIRPRKQIHVVDGNVVLGKHFTIKKSAYFAAVGGGKLIIGNDVYFNNNCMVVARDSITIRNHCSFGPNVIIYDHDHNFGKNGIEPGYQTSPIIIDSNCWIGGNVTILRGTHIGEGCIIGAGSVIKGEIPPYSVVFSNREITIRSI